MSHSRRWLLVCCAAALAVGFLAGRTIAPTRVAHVDTSTASSNSAARSGSTAASTRTEAGARAAAVAYATASQDWLYLDDDAIARAVQAIATPAAASTLAQQTIDAIGTAREGLAGATGRVWWLVRPLGSRVERFDGRTSRVVVWTVDVLSAAGVALPQADWQRVAVDLEWHAGAWRVAAVDTSPGPTPAASSKDRPWPADELDRALDGFQRARTAAGR